MGDACSHYSAMGMVLPLIPTGRRYRRLLNGRDISLLSRQNRQRNFAVRLIAHYLL